MTLPDLLNAETDLPTIHKGATVTHAIHRYEVPVDDAWHTIRTTGTIVHVACRTAGVVEFWAHAGGLIQQRVLRVYGTGHEIAKEDSATRPVYVGTALTPDGDLVWHLFELIPVHAVEVLA